MQNPFRDAMVSISIAAAWADGGVEDFEKQSLDRIMVSLGYSRGEIMTRISQALEGPDLDPIELPVEPSLCVQTMRYALAVTLSDGALSAAEVNFLAKLAEHLGLDAKTLETLRAEAEGMVSERRAEGLVKPIERLESLPPEARVKLADAELDQKPSPRHGPGEAVAGGILEPKVLYEGEGFGGQLEL